MTTTTVTLTGNVADAIGVDFDSTATKVWVKYNTDAVVTDGSDPIRLGAHTENVSADGTFSLPNVVASTSLVENLQATVMVSYRNTAGSRKTRDEVAFGPYDLSAESGTVDIRALEEVQSLDASVASQLMADFQSLLADAQALLDAQVDLSGIALPDSLVEALVKNTGGAGPLTSAALSAAYAAKDAVPTDLNSVSADGALTIGRATRVDATAAARTMTLADGTVKGQIVTVEKYDSSVNTVTVTGKIRSTSAGTLSLAYQYETITLTWMGTYWEPTGGHRTKASLDATYVAPEVMLAGPGITYVKGPWIALMYYAAGTVVRTAAGAFIQRNAPGLSRASYDATEVALWTTVTVDSTAAAQAKIDAAPQGAEIKLQAGALYISNLTFNKGRRLVGGGWQFYRDAGSLFGDAAYLDLQWYGGSAVFSSATSGIGITFVDTFVTGCAAKGFILVGPGSGTSIGIALGSLTQPVIDPDADFHVVNFATGVRTRNVNEGTLRIRARGCTTGAVFENGTNNVKIDLNVQKCVSGATVGTDCLGLTFPTPILQSNTGVGLSVNGTAIVVTNPYSESHSGIMAIDFVSGDRHILDGPSLNTTYDTVRVKAACNNARVRGMAVARLADESVSTVVDTPRIWNLVGTALGTQGWFSGTIASSGVLTSVAHGLVVGQTVSFTTVPDAGTSFARSTSATYYVQAVPTADTFVLAATSGGAAITTAVAGAFTGVRGTSFKNAGTLTGTVATDGTFTASGTHSLAVNDTMTFSSVPAGFTAGTVYYVKTVPTGTTFTLAATSGGTAITTGITAGAFTGVRNQWVNAASKVTKFRRSIDGLHLEVSGGVSGGASNTTIFTLPTVEFWPFATRTFFSIDATSGAILSGTVSQTGDVKIVGGSAGDVRYFDFVIPLDA